MGFTSSSSASKCSVDCLKGQLEASTDSGYGGYRLDSVKLTLFKEASRSLIFFAIAFPFFVKKSCSVIVDSSSPFRRMPA